MANFGEARTRQGICSQVSVGSGERLLVERRFGAPYAAMGLSESQCSIGYKLLVRPNGEIYPCEALKRDRRFLLGRMYGIGPEAALERVWDRSLMAKVSDCQAG